MENFEPKKLALIRILQILQQYSDCDHLLTHEEIIRKLQLQYGIVIERKAVARNISMLKEAGYEIETTQKGSYLAGRIFEDSELRLLCDSVLASRHITAKHSKDLIEKLSSLSNTHFKSRVNNVYAVNKWNKSENPSLFFNIEIICEAIEKKHKIKFIYHRYGEDGKFTHPRTHVASPYQMLMRNQGYYVLTREEYWKDVCFFRVDRISDIEILNEPVTDMTTIDSLKNGIDYKRISSGLPFMFTDKPERITIEITDEWMIDQIVDVFGHDFKIDRQNDKTAITLIASPEAMKYWAVQYLDHVEVISPRSLRQSVAELIQAANQKYKSMD